MSFSEIQIYRDWPVINGFVQVPNNTESDKSRVTVDEALDAISGSVHKRLDQSSGNLQGDGRQDFVRLPAITPNTWYSSDPVDDVADA